MGVRAKSYFFGVPSRTAFLLALLVAMGCLVWRVYGEDIYEQSANPIKYNGQILQNNYGDQKWNEKDTFDEKPEEAAETELGEDERIAMFEDEVKKQQKVFSYFDDQMPQDNQKGETVPKQPQYEKEGDETYESYEESSNSEDGSSNQEEDSFEQETFYLEDEKTEKSSKVSSSQEGDVEIEFYQEDYDEEDKGESNRDRKSQSSASGDEYTDVEYVQGQEEAQHTRVLPDQKGESESKSENAVVDEYFPGYEYAGKNKTNAASNLTQEGIVSSDVDQEQKKATQEEKKVDEQNEVKKEAEQNTNEAKDAYVDQHNDVAADLTAYFDPFQSALNFKERMDALYNAQIEGMNYRNYIFDGSQFVSQLRQSLLDELTKFREAANSVATLPLVESPPSVDVHEGQEEIVLDVTLPGTLRKSVRLELQNHQLILSGTRERRSCNTYQYGVVTFFHSFPVPRGVRSDDIRAQFDDEHQKIQIRVRRPPEERPDPTRIEIA